MNKDGIGAFVVPYPWAQEPEFMFMHQLEEDAYTMAFLHMMEYEHAEAFETSVNHSKYRALGQNVSDELSPFKGQSMAIGSKRVPPFEWSWAVFYHPFVPRFFFQMVSHYTMGGRCGADTI